MNSFVYDDVKYFKWLFVALIVFIALGLFMGCDEPTKWRDGGSSACADVLTCELKNSQWFRDYGVGNIWEWLFKETTFLAGPKGLLGAIEGSWKVEGGFLFISDRSCADANGMPIVGQYFASVIGDELHIGAFTDACTPRLTSIPGVWKDSI